jgi:hypothetical protein
MLHKFFCTSCATNLFQNDDKMMEIAKKSDAAAMAEFMVELAL